LINIGLTKRILWL